ncbi:MAG: leucine-rich repeat protein [Lachnospiraceae bacterium]|nr:leucine-rich repeat protein [Lachnospiraceae bacterium]
MKGRFKLFRLLSVFIVAAMLFNNSGMTVFASGLGEEFFDNVKDPGLVYGDWEYIIEEDGSAAIINYTGTEENLIIPEQIENHTVATIYDNAFDNNQNIKSVTVPDTVTSINAGAFANCVNLETVKLSQNLTLLGGCAFAGCTKIKNIYIPKSLVDGGSSTYYEGPDSPPIYEGGPFAGCIGLKNVEFEEGITTVANHLFYNCEGLESIVIPDTVTKIDFGAFQGCGSLKNVTLPDGLNSIEDRAFYCCESLKSIKIPDSVKKISYLAFAGCVNLETVNLPKNLTNLEGLAFADCIKIKKINIPKSLIIVTENSFEDGDLPGGPFLYCSGLKQIEFEDGVDMIPEHLFNGCDGIEEIVIPTTVTLIGTKAFADCENLKSITVPPTVTVIADTVFTYIEDLVMYGVKDSYAEEYATLHAIKFGYIEYPANEIKLNKNTLTIQKGKNETLTYTVDPECTTDTIKWKSDNTSIAEVDQTGKITAKSVGTTKVYAYAESNDSVKDSCTVTVVQSVTSITLDKTTATLNVGEKTTVKTTVLPEDASNKKVKWSTSNKNIATVDSKGNITAIAPGTATITATAADGSGKKATCKVTVKQPVTEITLNKTSLKLAINKTETLTPSVKPENASNKNVKWTTTNAKVAKVDSKGKVTAVGVGTATITATAADGSGVKATCKVTVVKMVTKVTLDKTEVWLHVGDTDTFKATVAPSDATSKKLKWTTTDANVVKVDSTGKVTAVGAGTATITATAADGSGKKATATIKVTALVTDVFDDVKSTDWFVNAVQYVYDHGIMSGTNGGKSFSPNAKLTREQFTQVLYAYEGKPEVANMNGFSDVNPNAWYAKSVYWAKEKGITGGKPDGTFGVGESISRQDLAVMFYSYAKIKNFDLTKNDNALDNFTDKGKISNYAKNAMKWAVTQGIMSGKGNGKVDPTGYATRAECATMIMKLIEKNK